MNKTGGRATFKGINYQALASISLFLQNVGYSSFKYIAFEQEKLKDFDLVFENKKIISESKSLKVTHRLLKEILDGLIKNNRVEEKDEVLVICTRVSSNLKTDLEYYKYFDESLKRLKKSSFSKEHIQLLERVKFWEIDSEVNKLVIESLFAQILGIWIPDSYFNDMLSNILLKNVYYQSEKGGKFTKEEFLSLIEQRKNEIKNDSVYYSQVDSHLVKIENVLNSVKDPNSKSWIINKELSALTASPTLYFLAIKRLDEAIQLNLRQWDKLWRAAAKGSLSLQVFNIFKKNIDNDENQDYLITLLPDILRNIVNLYREEFVVVDSARICQSVLSRTRKYDNQIFGILKQLYDRKISDFFYIKQRSNSDEWEKEEISKVLKELYLNTDNEVLKKQIAHFIFDAFNLSIEEGEFWHESPGELFEILKVYALEGENIEERLLYLSKMFSEQYAKYYKKFGKGLGFEGWEHMGSDRDKHLVTNVITPALEEYYYNNKDEAWRFITDKLISQREKQVSKSKPDFLNRAVINIVFKEYTDGSNKIEAFNILKNFIYMKRGIPLKRELVYRAIASSDLPAENKWNLVKIQLDDPIYKGLPAGGYVKQIVTELANEGFVDALNTLKAWSKNPKYYEYSGSLEHNLNSTVSDLLKSEKTQNAGIEILEDFIHSDSFKNKMDLWSVWKLANILKDAIKLDPEKGISILNSIWNQEELTEKEQVLITSTMNDLEKDDPLIKTVYEGTLTEWLTECEDNIELILKRFPSVGSRISIVQFGEKLARIGDYAAAVRIAKIFIKDPDPSNHNAKDDPEGKQNYHKLVEQGEDVNQITTVRGYVCWLLQSIAVLKGRGYVPDVISLVEFLVDDPNYYVRAYSCVPLQQLSVVRHTILPSDSQTRFLDIKDAEKIEQIAFKMLREKENWKLRQVMVGLVHVFANIRAITAEEAMEVLNIFKNIKDDKVIDEAASLYIFFAEFRSNAVNAKNPERIFGAKRYKEIKNFNEADFKKLLEDLLRTSATDVKTSFAWHFWKLPKEGNIDYEKTFNISLKYLSILIEKYDHEVFNRVYYFIDENLDKKPTECLALWKECIKLEKKYLTKHFAQDKLVEMHWWPYHYNGKILLRIAELQGEKEFLEWLGELSDYPEGVTIANDLNIVIDRLKTVSVSSQSKTIFEKIVAYHPDYFEKMKEWVSRNDVS
ncbi:hypothetical protein A2780_02540 [Candidatus Daviesbacteria bacterium RIFCSPHIGHO2_01_FULL_41_45]|uniref:Uncharacterized protein n=1 Tax=Candidatus Daviesbacteria bacterium RIFCSPLOWO2_01_FULL_40_24 TaxID=1797787 RepID=A0A1F5MJL1_9BACT|nr:MAG: hypothetical protein A2780_02540 [Candidatus Daviesbacteria bacterium RIFCSPHIGHO2_01_FULL_41_45]OGE65509.1 MAG: hypothetical protein A3B49_01695 [Candidatus Daviesbacteria bacterium RIFCSPLOWO2_01_FULL_40_24]